MPLPCPTAPGAARRADRKSAGATYTPDSLSRFMAEALLRAWPGGSGAPVRLLDPAIGEGALVLATLAALRARGVEEVAVTGFDICAETLRAARDAIAAAFPEARLDLRHADFLEHVLAEDPADPERFDLVIANPPYVRTQGLGPVRLRRIAAGFGLSGRFDLYQPFLVGIARSLAPTGAAAVVTSNRFLTTQAGASTREILLRSFELDHLWDLGDTQLFEAAVLPCVFAARPGTTPTGRIVPFHSIYAVRPEATGQAASDRLAQVGTGPASGSGPETPGEPGAGAEAEAADVLAALAQEGRVRVTGGAVFEVRHGMLDVTGGAGSAWSPQTRSSEAWLAAIARNTWKTFGAVGAVRVGVKTTADKVFIRTREAWSRLEPRPEAELLQPLTTHHAARRWRARPSDRQILYPHQSVAGRRQAIELAGWPAAAACLERHRAQLEGRTYVREAGRRWYEIWVPQDPALWPLPKLVWRDISERACFWLDDSGSIVNGDCYWMVLDPDLPDIGEDLRAGLIWLLLGVANSRLVERFYDARFNNRLYAGRRRFVTQYVREFPLPDPARAESRRIAELARRIHAETLEGSVLAAAEDEIDALVCQVFGVA